MRSTLWWAQPTLLALGGEQVAPRVQVAAVTSRVLRTNSAHLQGLARRRRRLGRSSRRGDCRRVGLGVREPAGPSDARSPSLLGVSCGLPWLARRMVGTAHPTLSGVAD